MPATLRSRRSDGALKKRADISSGNEHDTTNVRRAAVSTITGYGGSPQAVVGANAFAQEVRIHRMVSKAPGNHEIMRAASGWGAIAHACKPRDEAR